MPGDAGSGYPSQQTPYVKYQKMVLFMTKMEKKVSGGETPEAHIPLNEFDQNKMPKFN